MGLIAAASRKISHALGLRNRKESSDTFWTPGQVSLGLLPRTRINYKSAVGGGMNSSVLMSPIKWIQRTFPEARLKMRRSEEIITDHPAVALMLNPNPFYGWDELTSGLISSYIIDGNAYLVKMRQPRAGVAWYRNVVDPVEALWYVPHWTIEPRNDPAGKEFITHYRYSMNGLSVDVPIENVVHIRNGLNPLDTRRGLSMVESEMREIFTDDEAANFIATLLANSGVPGVVISPAAANQPMIPGPQQDAIKEQFLRKFTGDRRGEPLVTSGAVKVDVFGFDPKAMDLSTARDTAEERVCAAIGIPAAVVGFGTGLQQTKVGATMIELTRLAWVGCLIPMQVTFARQLSKAIIPEFEAEPSEYSFFFDQSHVAALQDELAAVIERVNVAVQGGWLTVAAAQAAANFPVDPSQNIYLRGIAQIEVPATAPATAKLEGGRHGQRQLKATALESSVIQSADRAKPSREQTRLIARLNREVLALEVEMDDEIQEILGKLGRQLAEAALDVLEDQKGARRKATDDEATASAIIQLFDFTPIENDLKDKYGAHYLRVARRTVKAISEVIGLAVDIPDERGREIVAAGGRRVGLIDLAKQTKRRLFRELAEGRSNGEGPVELARRIRDFVPAGPWSSQKVRARVIARTETLHAQRQSTLEAYRDQPSVSAVMVFDNRTGYDDEECAALDGVVVTIDEAWGLMNDEHPNGTRAFAPVVSGGEGEA